MKQVTISAVSRAMLEEHAQGNLLKPVVPVKDGFLVTFEDDVFEELVKWGPTLDEAIQNVCTFHGRKPS